MTIDNPGIYGWNRLYPSGTPPPERWGHRSLYIPDEQRMIMIAGTGRGGELNDAWALDLTRGSEAWEQLTPAGTPPSVRNLYYPVYHPGRRSVVFFGGAISGQRYNDLFELKLDSMVWREIHVTGTKPCPRSEGCVMFDVAGNRMVVFGGRTNEYFLNDVWALDLTLGSESWTQLTPSGTPPTPRAGSGWASDPSGTRLHVFGGWAYYGGHVFYNDLHVLDASGPTWTRIDPTGELPEDRRGAAACYDSWNERFVTYGGDSGSPLGDAFWIDCTPVAIAEWHARHEAAAGLALNLATVNSGQVRIRYSAPGARDVSLRIIDAAGRVVRNLAAAGTGVRFALTTWDGTDSHGEKVGAGAYYAYLQVEGSGVSRKFILTE